MRGREEGRIVGSAEELNRIDTNVEREETSGKDICSKKEVERERNKKKREEKEKNAIEKWKRK